jgi:hypothetical protein
MSKTKNIFVGLPKEYFNKQKPKTSEYRRGFKIGKRMLDEKLQNRILKLEQQIEELKEASRLMLDIINKHAPDSAVIELVDKILLKKYETKTTKKL